MVIVNSITANDNHILNIFKKLGRIHKIIRSK